MLNVGGWDINNILFSFLYVFGVICLWYVLLIFYFELIGEGIKS